MWSQPQTREARSQQRSVVALALLGAPRSDAIAPFSELIFGLREAGAACTFFVNWPSDKTATARSYYGTEIAKLIALSRCTVGINLAAPCSMCREELRRELLESMQYVLSVYGQTARFVHTAMPCIDHELLERLDLRALCARETGSSVVWVPNDERAVARVRDVLASASVDAQSVVSVDAFYDTIR